MTTRKTKHKSAALTPEQKILRKVWEQVAGELISALPAMPKNSAIRTRFLLYGERKKMFEDPNVGDFIKDRMNITKIVLEIQSNGQAMLKFRPAIRTDVSQLANMLGIPEEGAEEQEGGEVEQSLQSVLEKLQDTRPATAPNIAEAGEFQEFSPNPFFTRER